MLLKAGCRCDAAKGSHTKWFHPRVADKLILSGQAAMMQSPIKKTLS